METSASNSYDKNNNNVSQNALLCFQHGGGNMAVITEEATDATIWKSGFIIKQNRQLRVLDQLRLQ